MFKDVYTFWEMYWIIACVTGMIVGLIVTYPSKTEMGWGGKIAFILSCLVWPALLFCLFAFNVIVRIWPKFGETK